MWCDLACLQRAAGHSDGFGEAFVDELLVEVAAFQECAFDALVVEGVEDVADVAAVDVVFVGVDHDGAGDGELFADEAAAGGAFVRVAWRGVDAGEADGLAADDFEA
jgi:hypothetical protein